MPAWLQLLIVYTLVAACVLYSAATLLPRALRVGTASGLARWLPLGPWRSALEAYALRQGGAGACGGCGSCAAQPKAPAAAGHPPQTPAVQRVQWHRPVR